MAISPTLVADYLDIDERVKKRDVKNFSQARACGVLRAKFKNGQSGKKVQGDKQ